MAVPPIPLPYVIFYYFFLLFVISGKEAIQTQDIIAKLKQMSKSERVSFSEVSIMLKTLLTNHATNLVTECSWSVLRCLKNFCKQLCLKSGLI